MDRKPFAVYKKKYAKADQSGRKLLAVLKVLTVAHKFNVIQDVNDPVRASTFCKDSNFICYKVDFRDKIDQFSIRCGEYNVKKENKIFRSQESKVEQVNFHFSIIKHENIQTTQVRR